MQKLNLKVISLVSLLTISACSSSTGTSTTSPSANISVVNNKISDCGNEIAKIKVTKTSSIANFNIDAVTPENFSHNYKIVSIDLSDFSQGGKLTVRGKTGANGSSSFSLVNNNTSFKCSGFQDKDLSGAANIASNSNFDFSYNFTSGQTLWLFAEGSWGGIKDTVNPVELTISVQ